MRKKNSKIHLLLPIVLIPLIIIYIWGDDKTFESVVWGIIVSTFLMGAGFLSIKISMERSMKLFLGTIVGGIFLRLVFFIASGIYVLNYSDLPIRSYFISLLGYYLFYQFIEILYFNRGLKKV